MQFLSAETSQAFTRRVILPLAALVIGFVVFAIAGIFWIADYQTNVAIAQQARLATGAFRIQAQKLATSASDYGFWDDAVQSVAKNPDPAWMNENIGAGAEKSLGVDMSFVLDPQGKPIYSYTEGRQGIESPADYLGSDFSHAFDNWKRLKSGATYSGVLPFRDTAAAFAIAPVRSFSHPELAPTGFSIVFVKIIDKGILREFARDFELANLRIARTDRDIADRLAVIRIGDDAEGRAAPRFAWDPQRPGNGLLGIALPFLCVFLLLLIALAAVVLNHVMASAQLITDREAKASRDPLTGLANRSCFFSAVDRSLESAAARLACVTVMYVDLDGFKTINDTMGHAAGDDLLIQAALRFRSCVRETDLVARLGGDEFAILMDCRGERSQVQAVAARILLAISEPFELAAGAARISCSIGIADCGGREQRGADLVNQADRALYQAKASGKNAMRFATHELPEVEDLKVA